MKSIEGAFSSAAAFSQDVGGWDTSRVACMERMVPEAAAFDKDVAGWDTSKDVPF